MGSVCDLLASVKLLCLEMWKKDVQAVDELRLEVVLRMLRSPNFNAKMNALKEVGLKLHVLHVAIHWNIAPICNRPVTDSACELPVSSVFPFWNRHALDK